MPTRHTIVLSDVHLAEEIAAKDGWLRYRDRKFFPDAEFETLARVVGEALGPDDRLEVVLDGDVLELEAAQIDERTSFVESARDEPEAARALAGIVRDHPRFFGTLGALAAAGHHLVFVAGNHDAQLTIPNIARALVDAVLAHMPANADRSKARVEVQPWFFQTDDRIHVEHGHQYDTYCSFRDPLRPLDLEGREIVPTLGSLAFRHLVSRMGYFNAYDERSFMLSLPRYLWHWARYYMFTRRSLALTWFVGALKVVHTLVAQRPARAIRAAIREEAAVSRAAYARTLQMDAHALAAHAELFAAPADERPHEVVRELRLDHAALAAVGVAGLITAAFKPKIGLAITLAAVVAGVVGEIVAPRRETDPSDAVDGVARSVAKIHRARAVVFGHTHRPRAEVEGGILYANAGAWAPASEDVEMTTPAANGRHVVWIRRPEGDVEAPVEGGLYRLQGEQLRPVRVVTSEASTMGDLEEERVEGEAAIG